MTGEHPCKNKVQQVEKSKCEQPDSVLQRGKEYTLFDVLPDDPLRQAERDDLRYPSCYEDRKSEQQYQEHANTVTHALSLLIERILSEIKCIPAFHILVQGLRQVADTLVIIQPDRFQFLAEFLLFPQRCYRSIG